MGAGRGQRLMPMTQTQPKCFTEVCGRRILDWTTDAFRSEGLGKFIFIGGYLMDVVQSVHPEFTYVENPDWAKTNMLLSLMTARNYMADGFYATYTDTLYRSDAIEALSRSPHDITLVMDTQWRKRYVFRSQHPEDDGEKMICVDDKVVRVSREIPSEAASGEYTGLIRMTARGAAQFMEFYDDLRQQFDLDQMLDEDRPFRMAYLIHQLQRMIEAGIPVHCVPVPGNYHEIDTIQDYHLATADWMRFE